jgi:hypothetical protein
MEMKNEEMTADMNTLKRIKKNIHCTIEQRHDHVRSFLILTFTFLIPHFSFLICNAQTFTERIQKGTAGQASVTLHQSADIDRLVNSATLSANTAPSRPASNTGTTTKNAKPETPKTGNSTATPSATATPEQEADLSKKVIRNGIKVNGYRVQAFAGGNSRKDRLKAEQIGNDIKAHYGNVPVYVHFYSPRWICRVGNYRTYEEAHQMLQNLRKLGYNQASIVKGKITVQY